MNFFDVIIIIEILLLLACYFLFKKKKKKMLIIGSAPYVPEWCEHNLMKFIQNDYKIIVINHAYKVVNKKYINEHHISKTFEDRNSNKINKGKFSKNLIIHDDFDYIRNLSVIKDNTTMLFNVLYHCIYFDKEFDMYIIGCDMTYRKQGDTFYSKTISNFKKTDEKKYIKKRILCYGEENLQKELKNVQKVYDRKKCGIYNLSTDTTRLPFKRSLVLKKK